MESAAGRGVRGHDRRDRLPLLTTAHVQQVVVLALAVAWVRILIGAGLL